MAVTADVEAETMILKGICQHSDIFGSKLEFRGEESGFGIIHNGQINYQQKDGDSLLVIDGLDGSENYLNKTNWPYGTMMAISSNSDPVYNDFNIAGICLEEEGWIVLASNEAENRGVYLIDLNESKINKLPKFEYSHPFDPNKILADNHFPEAKELIINHPELSQKRTGSTAATVASLAVRDYVVDRSYPSMNQLHEILVDVTRKGNLEQPTVYLILKLLGGDVLDSAGISIGQNKFKTWGQTTHNPIFLMSNPSRFDELQKYLDTK